MTDSKALIERLRDYGDGDYVQNHHDRIEAADHIEKLEADNARLNDALRQAVIDAAEWARKAGEAQGKLEISEAAGILDGWKRDCERLRADNARLREALETIAAECCIPVGTDKQMYARWRALAASRVDVARAALAKRGLELREIEG